MTIKRVLVATDGSAGAGRALSAAAELVKAVDGHLLIVTISDNLPAAEMAELVRAEGSIGDALELLSKHILLEAREKAANFGVSNIHTRSAAGDAAEGIIGAARRDHADLVVVGRRGRGRLAGLILGSVSQKLVSLAPCLVLVVP